MKLILSAFLLSSAQAFVPHSIPFCRDLKSSLLRASTPAEAAIEEATRLSKTYGSDSKEARVAWDIVEELNASDNSAAFKGGISEDDCFIGDDSIGQAPEECDDYISGVNAIAETLKNTGIRLESQKIIAESVLPIPLSKVSSVAPQDSPAVTNSMMKALDDAKRITDKQGIDSSEAKLAWETVEEMASNDLSEAMKEGLDPEECLVEKVVACEALEEMQRVMYLEANSQNGRYQG